MEEASPSPKRQKLIESHLMPSSSDPMSAELQCAICLDVFNDPVTTPCGHNFCKICLKKCWDNSENCRCPNCKEIFEKRPELKINTTLRNLMDEHKKTTAEKQPEVFCDICDEVKLKAVKSCLVCRRSYCKIHLGSHLRETGLKKHKLIDPVNNLQDYICQKHERPLELFCRDDQTCVCWSCTDGDHKNHNTVTLEKETEERKTKLLKTQTDVQQKIQDRIKKIQDIKHSAKLRRRNTEKEKAASVEIFTDLIRSIERSQSELMKMMEEKQKAAEKQDEDLIKDLKQEITELKRRNTELEKITNTEDHLHLIQSHSSICRPLNIKNWLEISMKTHVSVQDMRRSLTKLQETLQEKIGEAEFKWMQQYAVDVTLDPDTANPYLILSDDNKQVSCGNIKHKLPNNPKRFDTCGNVLGKQGFSSGRFYYEVQVKGKTGWQLGVARESVNRKEKTTLTPTNGFWTLTLMKKNEYLASDDPLSLKVGPQKVGVFVDYEEGLVSFYDVESRSHIYSFTDQSFNEKLYPYFSPCLNNKGKNSSPLIITPVNNNK
ncbi:E3 ubiquitin-protein ligase TRIM39 [Misgurnus anguillicaudatus]|uniref:E3 ubiquitin-protein ligase TRIM39 n=1 Tax=Misgurnus anguillicaudatus TaxID=75329 RepID=UPI003CCF26A6